MKKSKAQVKAALVQAKSKLKRLQVEAAAQRLVVAKLTADVKRAK